MAPATPGRFHAIGVGPGDPELLTLKAVNILRRVPVVCHAGPEDRRGRAWEAALPHLRPDVVGRTVLTASMSETTAADWRVQYRPAVEQIAADCRAGRNVAFVTEGDPTLYSTAIPVWQLLGEIAPEVPLEIVPGVSSITAAAARAGWPLARGEEPLLIAPAGYQVARLERWLAEFPNLCLVKPARAMPQLLRAVEARGAEAAYVEELGNARELITTDLRSVAERRSYFSLILVRQSRSSLSPLPRVEGEGVRGDSPRGTRTPSSPSLSPEAGEKGERLCVIGLGPGDPRLLTCQADEALRQADVILGYDAYLRALASLGLRAELRPSPIGAEADRARQALELAVAGKRVALVSSGDPGVYGMASVLLEHAEQFPGVSVEVVPGVTAATAAASVLGAPLGHDFACVSLSDLLTPWELIENRLDAAGRADFVLAIYNPISQRRTWQLPRAREVLLRHRRPETVVGLADRAFRPDTRIWLTTLGELSAKGVGMETILLVGNSQTRVVNGRMVTPRGYKTIEASGGREPPEGTMKAFLHPLGGSRPPLARNPGQGILDASFAIIERELGDLGLPPWAFAVVRRMIHASADFEFAKTLRFSDDFAAAIQAALTSGAPVVTDTEMVLHGIRALLERIGVTVHCHLNDAEAATVAQNAGITRSAAGVRVAARHHPAPLLVIGNAPTALDEALRLVGDEDWRPAAVIGMPVGFVGVEEAKGRLLAQRGVAYLTCIGRKGGSAVVAAAVNALAEWVRSREVRSE